MTVERLRIDLWAPGMTALHRAGLGGLWMTLDEIEKNAALSSDLGRYGRWIKDKRSVILEWRGDGSEFLRTLFQLAYPQRDDGLISFLAYGDPFVHPEHALTVHTVMLESFLQHPWSRKAEKQPSGHLALDIDGEVRRFKYKRVTAHKFRDERFSPSQSGRVVSWLYPGGAERHVGLDGATELTEPPDRLLALRFGPVGCVFYQVRRRQLGIGWVDSFAIGIPELADLEAFATIRRVGVAGRMPDLVTAGPGEAAAKLMLLEAGEGTTRRIRPHACELIQFGRSSWSKQQSTRSMVIRAIAPDRARTRVYADIRRALPVRWHTNAETEQSWPSVSQVPELAAKNVLAGRPWWQDFAAFSIGRFEEIYKYDRGGLQMIVQNPSVLPDGPERTFVLACHEAWRRRLGELGERARREGVVFSKLVEQEYEKARIRFTQSKTVDDFRAAITDFWARARGGPTLQSGWQEILPFLGERRWREGRDLALLALASYARPEAQDGESDEEDRS